MRIQVGRVELVLEGEQELQEALRTLFRHLSNKELADTLGVSERTVRRWKDEGWLARRGRERVMLLDLLESVEANGALTGAAGPDNARVPHLLAGSGWTLADTLETLGGTSIPG